MPIAFILLLLTLVVLVGATGAEYVWGTEFAVRHVYHSLWFFLLWAATVAASVPCLRGGRARRLWLWHGALLAVLLGAGLSALTSRSGSLRLRLGVAATAYAAEGQGGAEVALPFRVELTDFDVEHHAGSSVPKGYRCRLRVDGAEHEVGLNRPLSLGGVRLCLASFDSDGRGAAFLVRSDPWGWPLTAAGYVWLFVAAAFELLARRGSVRRTWRALRRAGSGAVALAAGLAWAFVPLSARAAGEASRPRTVPAEVAGAARLLCVEQGGRICPFETVARDFCRKLSGEAHYGELSAEQVVLGWVFFPDDWNAEPLLRVKSRRLRERLDIGARASFNDFFCGGYRLGPLLAGEPGLAADAAEMDDCVQLVFRLRRGELFRLFPMEREGRTVWLNPVEPWPAGALGQADSAWARGCFTALAAQAASPGGKEMARTLRRLARWQQRHAGTTMPPAARLGAERFFHRMPSLLWLLCFTLGPGLLLFFGWLCGLRAAVFSRLVCAVRWLLPLVWLVLTVILGLRTYLSGRLPVGSGYETMLLGAWLLLLLAFCATLRWCGGVRQGADEVLWLLALPLTAAGLFLLVARFSERGATAIAQLTPVLESPLLSLHVGFTMMSYALLTLASLHAAAVLLRPSACAPPLAVLRTRLLLLVGECLLGVGIFLGAWWANEAWGRYWGWDPKEVWALVTWLLYAFPLHAASMPALRRPATFHAWVALAFLALVTTYFGVNFVLGGLHSYA